MTYIVESGGVPMAKGKEKTGHEEKKKPQHTLKEKRKAKKEKHDRA
jgi:hypothetical protein